MHFSLKLVVRSVLQPACTPPACLAVAPSSAQFYSPLALLPPALQSHRRPLSSTARLHSSRLPCSRTVVRSVLQPACTPPACLAVAPSSAQFYSPLALLPPALQSHRRPLSSTARLHSSRLPCSRTVVRSVLQPACTPESATDVVGVPAARSGVFYLAVLHLVVSAPGGHVKASCWNSTFTIQHSPFRPWRLAVGRRTRHLIPIPNSSFQIPHSTATDKAACKSLQGWDRCRPWHPSPRGWVRCQNFPSDRP